MTKASFFTPSYAVSKRPPSCTLRFPMTAMFRRILEGLADASDPEVQFTNVVAAFVWGGAIIETLTNDKVWEILEYKIADQFETLFPLIVRMELRKKIATIMEINRTRITDPEFDKRITRIIETRNRILHYKSEAVSVPADWQATTAAGEVVTLENLWAHFHRAEIEEQMPKLRIVQDLLALKVSDIKADIEYVYGAIDRA